MIKKLSILISLLIIVGCVSTPPVPEFSLQKNARIGVLIDLDETIGHQNYGVLKLNNFSKETKLNWKLNLFAKEEIQRLLEENGFEYVELSPDEMAKDKYQVLNLAAIKSNKWTVRSEAEKTYQNLVKEKKLNAIIAYKSSASVVSVECSNLGCVEFSAAHPGLYSRKVPLLKPLLFAVLPSYKAVTLLNPIADLGSYNNVYRDHHRLSPISGFAPNNLKELSENEWAVVEENLKTLISSQLKADVSALAKGSTGK